MGNAGMPPDFLFFASAHLPRKSPDCFGAEIRYIDRDIRYLLNEHPLKGIQF